jgi:MoaA/NifB/PqqE/SkfB family radical SAM enzyme
MNPRLLWLLLRINSWRQMLIRLFIETRIYLRYSTPRKLANLAQLQWQYSRNHVIARGYPYRYYVEPTNSCNLRCPFCFGWQERSRRRWGTMPLETFKSIVDQIAPYAFWVDLYNRGEPLLHPEIYAMIAYAHQRGIGTKISTNMNKLDDASAEQMVKSGLDYLVVSLDGATQETYASYRVGGDIDLVLTNLRAVVECKRRLRSATPYITIRTLIMRRNEHELPLIRQIAQEIGADNLIFVPMIVNIEKQSADQWLPSNPMYSFYDYRRRTKKTSSNAKSCAELWSRGTITWDGRVFPCCFADGANEALGDLARSDFLTIWNNEQYQASRAVFQRPPTSTTVTTVCTSCRGFRKTR